MWYTVSLLFLFSLLLSPLLLKSLSTGYLAYSMGIGDKVTGAELTYALSQYVQALVLAVFTGVLVATCRVAWRRWR